MSSLATEGARSAPGDVRLSRLRVTVLNRMLWSMVVLGAAVCAVAAPREYFGGRPLFTLFYLLVYGMIVACLAVRRLPYALRATVPLACLYAIGASELWSFGVDSLGLLFLLSCSVFGVALLGRRAGYVVAAGCGLTILGIAALYATHVIAGSPPDEDPSSFLDYWLTGFLVFCMLALLAIIFVSQLLHGLDASVRSSQEYLRELHKEFLERQAAEERLKRSEEHFRSLIENSTDVITVIAENGTIEYASPSVESVLGYPTDANRGREVIELVHPDDSGLVREVLQRGFEKAEVPVAIECRLRHCDGHWVTVEVTGKVSKGMDGRAILIVNYRDITERKQAEARLAQAKEEWERTFDALPELIAIVDKERRILRANRAMAKHAGCSQDECIGLNCCTVMHGIEMPLKGCPHVRLLDAAEPQSQEWTDARLAKTFLISTSPLRDAGGNLVGSVHVARDITERRELEQQLRQTQKMEAVGQLAGGIAHDFNNVLQAIQGYVEVARRGVDDDSEVYSDLSQAIQAADRAAGLVRQLLMFSRREMIQPKPVDLAELIGNLTSMLRRIIGEHIELELRHAPDLGLVNVDPGQMEQVLVNLCVNARDAMPDGGTICIETSNARIDNWNAEGFRDLRPGRYVALTVSDTGVGMEEGVAERVFEPFFTTKGVGKGTGMGLATVYGIVEQHGGVIEVDSEPGEGASFRILLPGCGAATTPAPAYESESEAVQGGDETILVAEDEVLVREIATRVLEEAGYKVLEASDGEAAIRVFNEHQDEIDLCLLDVVMPRKSGRAVYDQVRAAGSSMPVLFTSGYSHDALEQGSLPEDGYEMIQKPYGPDVLLRTIRRQLDEVQ